MSIDWANTSKVSKILVIGPGVTGNSKDPYVRKIGLEGIKQGFTIAVLHGRGIGNNKLKVIIK